MSHRSLTRQACIFPDPLPLKQVAILPGSLPSPCSSQEARSGSRGDGSGGRGRALPKRKELKGTMLSTNLHTGRTSSPLGGEIFPAGGLKHRLGPFEVSFPC